MRQRGMYVLDEFLCPPKLSCVYKDWTFPSPTALWVAGTRRPPSPLAARLMPALLSSRAVRLTLLLLL